MRKFVREGRKLRERKIGIFGGMDVRMGSMLFFPPGLRTHPPQPTTTPIFFYILFPASSCDRPFHAYEEGGW